MELRYYQQDAVEAVYRFLRERDDNPCVVIPTGGGKTPVIATIARDVVTRWNGRIFVLAHVKELLQQSADKIGIMAPELAGSVGLFSAGLNRKETGRPITVAGIQSAYRQAEALGPADIILVDECHLIPPDGEGMYRTFLEAQKRLNPAVRVIGLTATPYRMASGLICGPDNLLNEVCYEVGVRELIAGGFLSKLTSHAAVAEVDASGLHVRAGEFLAEEVEALVNTADVVQAACHEIVAKTADRRSVLIFAASVDHAERVMTDLRRRGCEVEGVFGDTLPGLREQYLEEFKSGRLKYLVNVGVLTTGFDAPCIDAVVLLRPTKSPGLYYQMCGRGFRLCEGKENCLILDFAGNVMRHGPLDLIEPRPVRKRRQGEAEPTEAPVPKLKKCPECGYIVPANWVTCPECQYQWKSGPHEGTAGICGILSDEVSEEEYPVGTVMFRVHEKRGAGPDAPRTMRVDYCCGLSDTFTEWVCPEHTGYAREKFEKWWNRLAAIGAPVPETAEEAVELARAGALVTPETIKVRRTPGEKFPRIVRHTAGRLPFYRSPEPGELDEVGPAAESAPMTALDPMDEIPF